jgi:hypothetical protein
MRQKEKQQADCNWHRSSFLTRLMQMLHHSRNAKKLADSLYNRILKGDDFGKLATRFSNDAISAAANGKMQEFGVGQYDATFEQQAFLTGNQWRCK